MMGSEAKVEVVAEPFNPPSGIQLSDLSPQQS